MFASIEIEVSHLDAASGEGVVANLQERDTGQVDQPTGSHIICVIISTGG